MSAYERKFQAALSELAQTGIWRSNYNTPMLRALRALGRQPRPPHYQSFRRVAVGYAVWFGVIWGVLMWLFFWQAQGVTGTEAILSAGFAGIMFGLSMAGYYAWGRKKYGLSSWEEL